MNIENFNDLLQAARTQPAAQRLLFVFVGVELPDDATPEQRAHFEAGHGGALVPLMCVDKTPEELDSFEVLAQEASQFGQPWALVFAAALSGVGRNAPTSADADKPLQAMVEAIKQGNMAAYVPFDAHGQAVHLG
ncbi:MAG: ribonucleotide reductase subunit alpha [Burkholderiales bacterium]|nr:ribonucleotide reductase subunit alpha [Burkholderiales bacterium]